MVSHLSNVFLKKSGNHSPQIDIFCTKNGCSTSSGTPILLFKCLRNFSESPKNISNITAITVSYYNLFNSPSPASSYPSLQEVQTYSFPYFFCYFTITHSLNYTSFSTCFPYKNLLFPHSCFIQK